MILRRTLNGAPLVTRQRTFASSDREFLDKQVNAFLEELSNNSRVTGFEISHGVSTALTSSHCYYKTFMTTIVWQEYAE